MQLVVRDANQGPFLTKVLNYAKAEQKLSEAQLEQELVRQQVMRQTLQMLQNQ